MMSSVTVPNMQYDKIVIIISVNEPSRRPKLFMTLITFGSFVGFMSHLISVKQENRTSCCVFKQIANCIL